ncbi:hypothetical protein ILYODFUR_031183 [Ilyodon furcidens]|uniref:Uncharacterized protein n=1 Tax=Ilyodon furcidens TaxID=33524 RepID=A0ABV0TDP3_9TELE
MSNHSSLAAPINGRSALLLSQSSPRASLLNTLCMENAALLLCFNPPPPLLHHGLPTFMCVSVFLIQVEPLLSLYYFGKNFGNLIEIEV